MSPALLLSQTRVFTNVISACALHSEPPFQRPSCQQSRCSASGNSEHSSCQPCVMAFSRGRDAGLLQVDSADAPPCRADVGDLKS
eukprot:344324-Rhodomonas_salina.1